VAQTFTTLHNFTARNNDTNSDGINPEAGLILSGSTLYGTANSGGSGDAGTVFVINTNGSGFTNLYSFTLSNAGESIGPSAGLVLSGNTLYGTTQEGGTLTELESGAGNGTVFKVNTDGTGYTNFYNFTGGNDGAYPYAGLILSGNTLYGTTIAGGSSGLGTVFAVSTNGTNFTNPHEFIGSPSDGEVPVGSLILSGNTLYGTTPYGGTNGYGTVFAEYMNGANSNFTILHNFTSLSNSTNSDGAVPSSGLFLSGSTLYGTTEEGGTAGNGTVFALNTNGMGFTNLYSFTALSAPYSDGGTNSDGALPYAGLILSGSTLYGTAEYGGTAGNGTIFALNTNGTGFAILHTFTALSNKTNSDGTTPVGGVILSANTLYGTAENGGTNGMGTVFSIYLGLAVTTTSLPNGTNGVAYSQQLSAVNGQPPYNWSIFSGSLPSGLTLVNNGLISGTPTNNGTFNFTVKVNDATSSTATQPLTLMVGLLPSIVAIQPTNNSVMVAAGNNINFSVSVAGTGPFSYQWQLNGTNLPNGIITTVAGGGGIYPGDGGVATNAELSFPDGVAVDASGNLFIADGLGYRIRKVGTNGIITTVAGDGTAGYSGDGISATNAELDEPEGVAVDASGNLFIADSYNNRIRKVGTNGLITTVAGDGTGGYSGDGISATNTELEFPKGVAVDATGNLFIADSSNERIREVGTNGLITTVAGNGSTSVLYSPSSVAVDVTGNIFIADSNNNRIREMGTNGIITTIAGNGTQGYSGDGGAATNMELNDPSGVAVDATGNLFIADSFNSRIREVGTNGIITTVAGNGTNGYSGSSGAATNAELNDPYGLALDATGNLFIADTINHRIRKVINPNIPGPTLELNDVGFGNAGAYDVVVSSPYGSVTSSVVNVTITFSPPVFQSAQLANGQFMLTWSAVSNGIYQLQYTTNLTQANWINIGNTLTASNTVLSATDANNTNKQRFYRVQEQ